MIRNQREYRHAEAQIKRLERGLGEARQAAGRIDDRTYEAMVAGFESQIGELREEVEAYLLLPAAEQLHLPSAHNLGQLLILARKARDLSQKELAQRLGMQAQQIQKYEKEEYKKASLERILRVMNALDLHLEAHITLTPYSDEPHLACFEALDRAVTSAMRANRFDLAREIVELADNAKSDWRSPQLQRWLTDVVDPEEQGSAEVQPTSLYVCFEALDRGAANAIFSGAYELAVEIARIAYRAAQTPDQRLRACNREIGGLDGQGRFTEMIYAARKGLRDVDASKSRRRLVMSNLASAHYSLWELAQAHREASRLIDEYENMEPGDIADEVARAHAYYVRGHSSRRMIGTEEESERHASAAVEDLQAAVNLYEALAGKAEKAAKESYRAIASTCRGGLIEADVALGRKRPDEALREIQDVVSAGSRDVQRFGDWRQSYAWWCVFGCNIALRTLESGDELRQYMTAWLETVQEVAREFNDWRLKERMLTLEYERRKRFPEEESRWSNELQEMAKGAKERFPIFSSIGEEILAA